MKGLHMLRTRLSSRWTLLDQVAGILLAQLAASAGAKPIQQYLQGGAPFGLHESVAVGISGVLATLFIWFFLSLKKVQIGSKGIIVKGLFKEYAVEFRDIRRVVALHPFGLHLLITYIPHVLVTFRKNVAGHRRMWFLPRIVPNVWLWHPHPDVVMLKKLVADASGDQERERRRVETDASD